MVLLSLFLSRSSHGAKSAKYRKHFSHVHGALCTLISQLWMRGAGSLGDSSGSGVGDTADAEICLDCLLLRESLLSMKALGSLFM
jgi:hypothetical protein